MLSYLGSASILLACFGILPKPLEFGDIITPAICWLLRAECSRSPFNSRFIKLGAVARVLFQNFARRKLLVTLGEPFHFIDQFPQTEMVGESQRSAAICW